jgi:ATP-dependent helicase/nuclease subunit A
VTITKAELERARKAIQASYEEAARPSYKVETVTSLAKKERETPARKRDTGLGLSWGRLVHQILEAIGSGRLDPKTERTELFVENLLAAEEGDYSDREMLIAHVKSIVESEFWQRIVRAERRYFEIPFSIRTTEKDLADPGDSHADLQGSGSSKAAPKSSKERALGPKAGRADKTGLPVILNGTIDLVFWEDAGWVIADYKTDFIRPQLLDDDLADLVKIYAPQVRLYARFWSETTGEPVKEAGLYFTSIDRWVKI